MHYCLCLVYHCFYLNQNITQVYPNRKEILRKYAPASTLIILKNRNYQTNIESIRSEILDLIWIGFLNFSNTSENLCKCKQLRSNKMISFNILYELRSEHPVICVGYYPCLVLNCKSGWIALHASKKRHAQDNGK